MSCYPPSRSVALRRELKLMFTATILLLFKVIPVENDPTSNSTSARNPFASNHRCHPHTSY